MYAAAMAAIIVVLDRIAIAIAIAAISGLLVVVAVDVSDAGDRLQPRRDAGRTADGPQANRGQSRHRRTAIAAVTCTVAAMTAAVQGAGHGQFRYGRGVAAASATGLRRRLLRRLLVRRAGQVGHAGLVEGALPAVARAVAVIVTLSVAATVAVDGTGRQRRGAGRSLRGRRSRWSGTASTVSAVAAVVVLLLRLLSSSRSSSNDGIAASGRPAKHCEVKGQAGLRVQSNFHSTVAPVSARNAKRECLFPFAGLFGLLAKKSSRRQG